LDVSFIRLLHERGTMTSGAGGPVFVPFRFSVRNTASFVARSLPLGAAR
jgi:hypothetical protein